MSDRQEGRANSVNPNNPRVQRQLANLRDRFEERSQQQRQKYERELRDAAETGRLHSLGEVADIYAEKRSDNGSGWGILLFMLILLCGIGGVGQVSTQLLKQAPLAHKSTAIAIIVSLVAGLVVLLVFSVWLLRRRPTYTWLYAYTDGLAMPVRRGGPPDVIRWDNVESLYNVWKNNFNPVSEDSEPRFVAYRVRLNDGREPTFPLSYRNMLDPYADVGPLLTAILPGPVAATLPAQPNLSQLFEHYIVQRKLPEMLNTFRGGHPVDFGELRLDSIGLVTDQGRKTLAWHDVQSITPEQDTIVIKQHGQRAAWIKIPITETPNAAVLFALLAQTGVGQAAHP